MTESGKRESRSGKLMLRLIGSAVSKPYLRMTQKLMMAFAVRINSTTSGWVVHRRRGGYRAREFAVPPDASAASYFEAAAALCGGSVTIRGLSRDFNKSLQGDVTFVDYLEKLGCHVSGSKGLCVKGPIQKEKYFLRPLNMADVSDVAITLAVISPFLPRATTICGLGHMRSQETDRVRAVAEELAKVGVRVEHYGDGWKIHPAGILQPAEIETYNDHRIAMAFSILGLKDVMGNAKPWIRIKSPACVNKTFPDFYEKLEALRR